MDTNHSSLNISYYDLADWYYYQILEKQVKHYIRQKLDLNVINIVKIVPYRLFFPLLSFSLRIFLLETADYL